MFLAKNNNNKYNLQKKMLSVPEVSIPQQHFDVINNCLGS